MLLNLVYLAARISVIYQLYYEYLKGTGRYIITPVLNLYNYRPLFLRNNMDHYWKYLFNFFAYVVIKVKIIRKSFWRRVLTNGLWNVQVRHYETKKTEMDSINYIRN